MLNIFLFTSSYMCFNTYFDAKLLCSLESQISLNARNNLRLVASYKKLKSTPCQSEKDWL